MPVSLSDLLAPTPQPTKAGAGAFAPSKAGDDSFAAVLAAAPRATAETPAAPGTLAAQADLAAVLNAVLQSLGIINDPAKARQTPPAGLPPTAELPALDIDPAVLQRLQQGAGTAADFEAFKLAFEKAIAAAQFTAAPGSGGDEAPANAGAGGTPAANPAGTPVAGIAVPAAPSTGDADSAGDSVEMALRIAEAKPAYVPPQTDRPAAPPTLGQDGKAPELKEGRSAAAGPPPLLIDKDAAAKTDIPQVSRAVLAALAPRATVPEMLTPGTPVSPATSAVSATASQTNIPPQAQALAAMPHVTSVRASTAAEAPPAGAPAARPQITITPQAQASATPSETPAVTAAAAPAAGTAPAPQPTVVPQTVPTVDLTGGAATEEKAADAALSALVKDKPETKPEGPPAKPVANAADPEIASPKKAASDADVKAKDDAKPEPQAQTKSMPAEKPSAPEPRAPQHHTQQLPAVTDRVILHDASVRAVQQTAQYLPAAAIPQIAGEMAMRLRHGQSRFEIRLDPPELGRIDVRIEVDSDGHVHSRLMVEKTETLDLLKADQRALERALHDAGFKSEQNSLSFSLRDQRGGHAGSEQQRFMNETNVRTDLNDDPARLAAELAYRATLRGPGGIDLRV